MIPATANPDKAIVVIGGGCWGHWHATRLLLARDKGKTAFSRLLIVDRNASHQARRAIGDRDDVVYVQSDWAAFLDAYVAGEAGPDDQLVLAPVAPHLLLDWLVARTPGARREAVAQVIGTPFESAGAHGERFLSFAEWRCPVSCLEPSVCPAIRTPRTWEMAETLQRRPPGIVSSEVFVARHHAWGIATIPLAELMAAQARLAVHAHSGLGSRHWVATVSACHGVVGQLALGPLGA